MDLKHQDHLDEETGGQRAGGIRAERWESVLIRVFGGLVVISLAVMFWDWAEKCIVQLLGIEYSEMPKYEALKFLGIGMGGVLLALQALIANKRAQAMEKTATAQAAAATAQAAAATAQAQATEEQATANKNTEQGQRQERLKNAIEHLGHDSDSVRLGGAYELFHLAEDEDTAEGKKDLRRTVLDILCAHIRRTTREPGYGAKEKHQSNPSEEIQSLLTLLFVQEHKVFTEFDINLQGSWLNGSNLRQARLEKADLREAQLKGADLREARLHGASLWEAQLHGADLREARLYGASLREAQLKGADLWRAQLQGAELGGAQLHGASLRRAQLQGADLWEAQLQGADLWGAKLQGASLRGAQLQGAFSHNDLIDFNASFEASINKRIGEESDLSSVTFAGGLPREYVDSICNNLSDEAAKELRGSLEAHIGPPASHELLEYRGAIMGTYTKEDAAQWIAEYKTALSAVSESG